MAVPESPFFTSIDVRFIFALLIVILTFFAAPNIIFYLQYLTTSDEVLQKFASAHIYPSLNRYSRDNHKEVHFISGEQYSGNLCAAVNKYIQMHTHTALVLFLRVYLNFQPDSAFAQFMTLFQETLHPLSVSII